jgi:hypothetical protein
MVDCCVSSEGRDRSESVLYKPEEGRGYIKWYQFPAGRQIGRYGTKALGGVVHIDPRRRLILFLGDTPAKGLARLGRLGIAALGTTGLLAGKSASSDWV